MSTKKVVKNALIASTVAAVTVAPSASKYAKAVDKEEKNPPNVILDMDFGGDIDDAMGLCIAMQADKEGLIDLKAVCLTVSGEGVTDAVCGLLDSRGFTDIPIGVTTIHPEMSGSYYSTLAEYKIVDHQIMDADELYMTVCAECVGPINIITTGHLTNLSKVLSREDKEYFLEKVDTVFIGGGHENGTSDVNFAQTDDAFNATLNVQEYFDRLNAVFIPYTFASPYVNGYALQDLYPNGEDAMAAALNEWQSHWDTPYEKGRISWDPSCVWVAIQYMNDIKNPLFKSYPLSFKLREDNTLRYNDTTKDNSFEPNATGIIRTSTDYMKYSSAIESILTERKYTPEEITSMYTLESILSGEPEEEIIIEDDFERE